MNLDVTKEEAGIIMDGLSALPLQKSYNLFNKLMQQLQQEGVLSPPPQTSSPETPAQ